MFTKQRNGGGQSAGYFDSAGVKGTFGLFDNGHGHFTIYNLASYRDSFYSPGQTFDIFQSLIAIQTGIKKDDLGIDTGVLPPDLGAPPNFGQEFRDTGSVNPWLLRPWSMISAGIRSKNGSTRFNMAIEKRRTARSSGWMGR